MLTDWADRDDPEESPGGKQNAIPSSVPHLRADLQMREYVAVSERVARLAHGPVLDWGCGYGQMTNLLRARGLDVTAFDWQADAPPDHHIIRLEPFYPNVEAYKSSDPVRLPFGDDSFHCVLSCGVLEHVPRPQESLDELHRVLTPGGRLLIYKLPNRTSYLEAIARLTGMYYHGAHPSDEVYTRRSATRLVSSHGFAVDAFRRANMLPLTITHPLVSRLDSTLWFLNRRLAWRPLSFLATNIEIEATALPI